MRVKAILLVEAQVLNTGILLHCSIKVTIGELMLIHLNELSTVFGVEV